MKHQYKRKFKFKWKYLDQFANKKKMSFDEMLQEYLKTAKETQRLLEDRTIRKRKG